MELVINDDNLQYNEINEFSSKVRAILVDENNQILVVNYGSTLLLPGGKVEVDETNLMAIIRELSEELGTVDLRQVFRHIFSRFFNTTVFKFIPIPLFIMEPQQSFIT